MRDYSGLYGADDALALYGSANQEAGYGHVTDQLNDLRRAALYALGIPLGQNNDMVLTWLHMNGATSDDLNDAWREMLNAQLDESLRTGQLNDDWYTLLGTLGFTGTINDREYGFWYAGGEFGDTSPTWFGLSATYYVYEIGDGLTIQLSEHCYGRPPEITYTSTVPTCDPNTGELVITWADIGSAPGANAVTVTATNTAGMGQTSFTVIGVAGEADLPPQLVAGGVPDVYSTYGQLGVDPSIRAQSGLPMQDYFTSTTIPEYVPPGSVPPAFEMVASSVAQIDPDTGVMTGKPSAAVNDYNLQAFARNSVGQSPTNWFLWQVLPVGGWVVDFTSVDPDTLGGLTYTSTSETFSDYLAQPQTVGPNVPAMVGQEWDGSNYTQRGVSYGIQVSNDDTELNNDFTNLAGLPTSLPNNYCVGVSFRLSKDFSEMLGGEEYHYAIELESEDGTNGVGVLFRPDVPYMAVTMKLNDDQSSNLSIYFNDNQGDPEMPNIKAGDLLDVRFRKSDDVADNGYAASLYINGVQTSSGWKKAVGDATAPHQSGLSLVSVGRERPDTSDHHALPAEYNGVRIVAQALSREEVDQWPTWAEPTPILDPTLPVDPPYLHFGEGPVPPPATIGVAHVTVSLNTLYDDVSVGGASAVFTASSDASTYEWMAETALGSGVWESITAKLNVTGSNSRVCTVTPDSVANTRRVQCLMDGVYWSDPTWLIVNIEYPMAPTPPNGGRSLDQENIAPMFMYAWAGAYHNLNDFNRDDGTMANAYNFAGDTFGTANLPFLPSPALAYRGGSLARWDQCWTIGEDDIDPRHMLFTLQPEPAQIADGMTLVMAETRQAPTLGGTSMAIQSSDGTTNRATVGRMTGGTTYSITTYVSGAPLEQDTGIEIGQAPSGTNIISLTIFEAENSVRFSRMDKDAVMETFSGLNDASTDTVESFSYMNDPRSPDSCRSRASHFAAFQRGLTDLEVQASMLMINWRLDYGREYDRLKGYKKSYWLLP